MNLKKMQKLSGLAVMLGALLMTIYAVGFNFLIAAKTPADQFVRMVQNPNFAWLTMTVFIALISLIFGFIGVYSKIHDKTGVTGLLGFVLIEVAYVIQVSKVTWEMVIYPVLADNAQAVFLLRDAVLKNSVQFGYFRVLASVTILSGIILFCWSIVRSKRFPAAGGILVLIGAVTYGLSPVINNVFVSMGGIFVFAVGSFLIGTTLLHAEGK